MRLGSFIPSISCMVPTPPRSSCLSSQELPYTKDVIEAGLAEDTHLYYMALIERGTGKGFPSPGNFCLPQWMPPWVMFLPCPSQPSFRQPWS